MRASRDAMSVPDWAAWHRNYDDPSHPLTRRLTVVREHVASVFRERRDSRTRVIVACAGEGRDVIPEAAAAENPDAIEGLLVEMVPELASAAREAARRAGLSRFTVVQGDAGDAAVYAPAVPADLMLFCGVFGWIGDEPAFQTIDALPRLAAPGATVIWTRHHRPPDATDELRARFAAAGFEEAAFVRLPNSVSSVGVHRLARAPQPFDPSLRLFTFDRDGRPATHFLHVRKTGGSAVSNALRDVAGQHRIIVHGHHTRLSDVPRPDRVFSFARDPVERYISGFNSRYRHGRPLRDFAWTASEERAFARFRTPDALATALSSPDPELAGFAREAMHGINHVSSSYADWFTLDELVANRDRIVLLGLQAHLEGDFAFLKDRLGLPDGVELPSDPVGAHRTPPEFEQTLSAEGRRNIEAWYAADLAFYDAYKRLRAEWFGLDCRETAER